MQLTKSQNVLHVIFRILVFLALGVSVCEFFMFMSLGIAGSSSTYSYSSTLGIAVAMCNVYYVLLVLGILTVVFSLICCRCTNVASTVTRTIFLALAAGFNFTSFPAYTVIRRFAQAYITGNYYSVLREYRYADSDDFETALVFVVLFTMISIAIYFVLSITSIVALAKKPQNYNNAAYQQYYQQLYGRGYYNANGQWVNGRPMNNQWNGNNPQMNQGQWNGNNPQMNQGQWNENNPQPKKSGVVLEKAEQQQEQQPVQAEVFDENGVKQSADGRKILRYDTMTGEPIYAEETQEQTENHED